MRIEVTAGAGQLTNTRCPKKVPGGIAAVHNVYFVKYDVTVYFLAQVLDTVTYFVSHVLDSGYSDIFWHIW